MNFYIECEAYMQYTRYQKEHEIHSLLFINCALLSKLIV
uniref:Uncharacterized protein n=1 Tax=Anguilla anguilla TaxID=7936 RepID=A0A0E9VRX9_ANGAN